VIQREQFTNDYLKMNSPYRLNKKILNAAYLLVMILHGRVGIVSAQLQPTIRQRVFQFSFTPGFGTNGIQPGSFSNAISLNATSGYSASNSLLELALISNLNTENTKGLQIAGLINLTGGNAFGGLSKKDRELKIKNGYRSYLHGLQISGMSNVVLDEVYGAQISCGLNLVKGSMIGAQFSILSNVVYSYSFGVQASGLFNVSATSIDGVQIAGLHNYTSGTLSGVQVSLINQVGQTEGKNSLDKSQPTGVQLGILNLAKSMNGFQIGIVNISKVSQGTQIGLVNFYKNGKQPGTRNGTAIGLLNIGDIETISIYTNEIFGTNYEISTGTRKNGRVNLDKNTVHITNSLIYSDHSLRGHSWGVGYGLKKMFCNRSALPGVAESKFVSVGADFQHISTKPGEFTKNLSLLSRIKLEAGKRITSKSYGFNWFGSITFNCYLGNPNDFMAPNILKFNAQIANNPATFWVGYSVGLILH